MTRLFSTLAITMTLFAGTAHAAAEASCPTTTKAKATTTVMASADAPATQTNDTFIPLSGRFSFNPFPTVPRFGATFGDVSASSKTSAVTWFSPSPAMHTSTSVPGGSIRLFTIRW